MDYAHLTVTLGADGRAYGNGGCNHWFAPYTVDGDKLSFGKIGSTRKLCAAALMEQSVASSRPCKAYSAGTSRRSSRPASGRPKASRFACGWKKADHGACGPNVGEGLAPMAV